MKKFPRFARLFSFQFLFPLFTFDHYHLRTENSLHSANLCPANHFRITFNFILTGMVP